MSQDPVALATLLSVLRDHGVTEYADGTLTLKLGQKPLDVRVVTTDRVTKSAQELADEDFEKLKKQALGVFEMAPGARL